MADPVRKADRQYTYGDYKNWPDDERWELIDGVAWNMSPAPNRMHQHISMRFLMQIGQYLGGGRCEVYHAPFDVLLPDLAGQKEDEIVTVVQPDISVICDRDKLTDKGCTGAPDWLIEILSPYTAKKDIEIKHHLYERHGVREYWLVDPGNAFVHVYSLAEDGKYPEEPAIYLKEDRIPCVVLSGLTVDLKLVFNDSQH